MPKRLQKIIYKFRDWDNLYTNRILTNQEIYFANPSEFNDPFDVGLVPDYSLLSVDEWKRKLAEIENHPYDISPEQRRLEIDRNSKFPIWEDNDRLDHMSYSMLQNFRQNGGVFSGSARCGHPLMWSHYAKNHTGLCIGFKSQELFQEVDAVIGSVIYCDSFIKPKIKPSLDGSITDFLEVFNYKSPVWTYEKEIRLFKIPMKNKVTKISKGTIDQVILGSEMSRQNKRKMYEIIRSDSEYNHVKVYSAHKRSKTFLLRCSLYNPKTNF